MKSKKIIALILGLSMTAGSSPSMVFAEELTEGDPVVAEEDAVTDSEDESVIQDTGITVCEEIVSVGSDNDDLDEDDIFKDSEFNGIYWELYYSGKLIIYGTGAIPDYDVPGEDYATVPEWSEYSDLITSVIVDRNISGIGKNSFYGCKNLTYVYIADTVTNIGAQAFMDCSSLNSFVFEDYPSLGYIGYSAFENCTALDSFSFPSSLREIGGAAFKNCDRLTSISFPQFANLSAIFAEAFADCDNLENVDLSWCSYLTTIQEEAFSSCDSLASVLFPLKLETIGENAFLDCTSLKSVTIPRNVETIDNGAFKGCVSVTDVYCCPKPANLTWVGENDFKPDGSTKLHVLDVDTYTTLYGNKRIDITDFPCGDNASCYYDSEKDYLYITGSGDMYDFEYSYWEGIDTRPWSVYIGDVLNIMIEDDITSVGAQAFNGCALLNTVFIPQTVTKIGNSAFYYCEYLENLFFGPDPMLKSIGRSAFGNCYKLDYVPFEDFDCLESIGFASFQFTSIQSITIPASVKEIQETAFADCYKVTSLTFEDLTNEVAIPDNAFSSTMMTSLVLPANITSIGEYAFSYCKALQSVTFAENSKLNRIDYSAFYTCEKLATVEIPASVTEIGISAFLECSALENVIFEENSSLKIIGASAFSGNTTLSVITIPASVTTIGESAFSDCTWLTAVNFEEGSSLQTIGYDAFYYTRIENITIPKSVTEIGSEAFRNCYYLEAVFFEKGSGLTKIQYGTFRNCQDLNTIVFPDSLKEIENTAFESCNDLTGFMIPSGVTKIGSTAFRYCWNISDVYCYADPSNLEWDYDDDCFMRNYATLCHVYADRCDEFKTKFDLVNVTFVPDLVGMNAGVVLAGHSLTLDGAIGVNFFMELSDDVLSADDPYMLFTLANGTTQKVYVKSDANISASTVPGKVFYVFQCRVAAKQMTEEITAQIYLADNVPVEGTYTYTVRDYADYIVKHYGLYNANVVTLVKSMLNYGTYSQQYFNYNTANPANANLTNNDKRINSIPADFLNGYKYTGNTMIGNTSIRFASVNLELESELVMNLYFENVPDGVVFKLDGSDELPSRKSGDYTVVSIKNIPAQNLSRFYTVGLYSGEEYLGYVSYSPMNYCYNVIARDVTPTRTLELKNLIKTLYWFYDAAYAL